MPAAAIKGRNARTYRALAGIGRSLIDRYLAILALRWHFDWKGELQAAPLSLSALTQISQALRLSLPHSVHLLPQAAFS